MALHFVSIEELTTPRNGYETIVDNYWIVDPEKGAAFYLRGKDIRDAAPQCNRDENVTKLIQGRVYPQYKTQLIHVAYIPMRRYE